MHDIQHQDIGVDLRVGLYGHSSWESKSTLNSPNNVGGKIA